MKGLPHHDHGELASLIDGRGYDTRAETVREQVGFAFIAAAGPALVPAQTDPAVSPPAMIAGIVCAHLDGAMSALEAAAGDHPGALTRLVDAAVVRLRRSETAATRPGARA